MSKVNISHDQAVAVLASIYHELKIILKVINTPANVSEDSQRRKRIINDIKYLLQKTCKVDLTDASIFDLFKAGA